MRASWPLLLVALSLLYLASNSSYLTGRDALSAGNDLEPSSSSSVNAQGCPLVMMEIGERSPLVFKCAGELTSSLAPFWIPHYFSLPLHRLELEPLIEEHLFRTPPDPATGRWSDEALEDRQHIRMLPDSLHRFVCEINELNPALARAARCGEAMPLRAVLDAVLPARRIMLDVGGNTFPTSVGWFKRNYPVEFTHIYVWEEVEGLFVMPDARTAAAEYDLSLAEATRWLESVTFFNERVHWTPDGSNGDLAHMLLTHVKPEDYCVVKIDIENGEWDLVPHLEETRAIQLIDELFIEIHFHTELMGRFPDRFPRSIEETTQMMARLRRTPNLIFHYWP